MSVAASRNLEKGLRMTTATKNQTATIDLKNATREKKKHKLVTSSRKSGNFTVVAASRNLENQRKTKTSQEESTQKLLPGKQKQPICQCAVPARVHTSRGLCLFVCLFPLPLPLFLLLLLLGSPSEIQEFSLL